MKKYKKLLIVAPLACMLGTGMFTLPNASYADQPDTYWGFSSEIFRTYSKENLAKSLRINLSNTINSTPELREKFKLAGDEFIQTEMQSGGVNKPEIYYGLEDQLNKVELGIKGTSFNVNPIIDSYEDLNQTNLLTINNDDGILPQTGNTPETTKKVTESMSYSSSTGQKFGIESTTSFKVSLPFNLGEANQSIKIGTEFTFNQSSSNTTTQETAVTFKSQPVVAAPGGTTTFYGTIKKAKFSGTFQTDAYLSGVTLKLPIVKAEAKDGFDLNRNVVRTEEVTLSAKDIYTIFKVRRIPMPDYLKIDDQNKQVILNNADFTFKGEGGYYTTIQVKFIPKNTNKAAQVMPYKEYVAKAQQGAL